MDSPPHILKPLRTILLETASEEKVGPCLQEFYLESAECRLRPLSSDFRELTLKNVLSCWSDFRPDVQDRLSHQVIGYWQAFYTPLEREPIADLSVSAARPPASATSAPDNGIIFIRPKKIPSFRRKEFAARSKLPDGSGEVPFACSHLPIDRSKMPAVSDKVLADRGDRPKLRSLAPTVTIGVTAARDSGSNFLDDTPVVAAQQSVETDRFFKSQDHSDWFDKILDFVAALMSVFYLPAQ